jgi:hypothetical protein
MTATKATSTDADDPRTGLASTVIRWGGLAAVVGPLLVLSANIYGLWETQTYGSSPEATVEAVTTTASMAFGGVRLFGGMLLVFGLIALYAYQIEAAGRLGLVGFVISMIGTVLLTALAWLRAFVDPALASQAPEFYVAARSGEIGGTVGAVLSIGVISPILFQALGWTIFGIATYRARVFPRWLAVGLVVGALLLFVPVQGGSVVFQLAVASMGVLLFLGRAERPSPEQDASQRSSESAGG